MSLRRMVLPFVVLPLVACTASPPASFPMTGDAGALARLSGEWAGTYASPMLSRSGSIVLTFAEGLARGDVIMVPPGQSRPVSPAGRQAVPPGTAPAPESPVLTIEFAQATGDSLVGTMAPYQDPDCQCTVQTTFTGRLSGDVITGTFVSSRTIGGQRVAGTWEVRRRR